MENGKRKTKRFSLVHLPFAHHGNGSLSFVDEETNGSYPFTNGLNRLSGHTHLCLWQITHNFDGEWQTWQINYQMIDGLHLIDKKLITLRSAPGLSCPSPLLLDSWMSADHFVLLTGKCARVRQVTKHPHKTRTFQCGGLSSRGGGFSIKCAVSGQRVSSSCPCKYLQTGKKIARGGGLTLAETDHLPCTAMCPDIHCNATFDHVLQLQFGEWHQKPVLSRVWLMTKTRKGGRDRCCPIRVHVMMSNNFFKKLFSNSSIFVDHQTVHPRLYEKFR